MKNNLKINKFDIIKIVHNIYHPIIKNLAFDTKADRQTKY